MATKFDTPEIRLAPALEVKFADVGEGQIAGYAATFNGLPDGYGDTIAPNAFTKSLKRIAAEARTVPMLWSHSPSEPIGTWSELREDGRGLFVRGQLNGEVARAREIRALAVQKAVTGISIGFEVPDGGRRKAADGSFRLEEIELWECSLCVFPANASARLTDVKIGSKSELIDVLRERGFAKAAATRLAGGGWPALASGDDDEAKQLMAALQRSAQRLKG